MSEIDDIFASKSKGSSITEPPPIASHPLKKEKKKNKKRKRDEPTPDQPSPGKPAPQTVIDTSNRITSSKRTKIESRPKASRTSVTEDFSDSRGSRSRKTTEEGWKIYKEDELGIGDEGGDTPLCPFDCDCCF